MSTTQTMRRIIVTMPPDLVQQVEEMASRLDFNRSQFIRQAVKAFIEEQREDELLIIARVNKSAQDICRAPEIGFEFGLGEAFSHAF